MDSAQKTAEEGQSLYDAFYKMIFGDPNLAPVEPIYPGKYLIRANSHCAIEQRKKKCRMKCIITSLTDASTVASERSTIST